MLTRDEKERIRNTILIEGVLIPRCGFIISYLDMMNILDFFTEREAKNGVNGEWKIKSNEKQEMDEGSGPKTNPENSESETSATDISGK